MVPSLSASLAASLTASSAALRALVAARAGSEGRTDSLCPGLRYYRFSQPVTHRKLQVLMPGIVVVLQGRKTVAIRDAVHAYGELQCLILGAGVVCEGTVVTADAQSPYLAIHLDLPPALVVKTLLALPPAPELATASAMAPEAAGDVSVSPVDARVLDAFLRLLPATDDPADLATIAPLLIEEIVVRLLRSGMGLALRRAAAVTRSAARIHASMQFMAAQHAKPLTVSDLASEAAMSDSHYAHCFREVSGVSPMRYLRDVRLEAARQMLLGSQSRPGEVAFAVGFDSVSHFTRAFKQRFEASPAAYVRRMASAMAMAPDSSAA